MFYPVESLKRGGKFYLCWVADSWPLRFATITRRQLWSQDIRKICDDLLEVIMIESGQPARRFSLRLSSQLMRGLARIYQRKVTDILSDLCMINAHVSHYVNKKLVFREIVVPEPRPQLPLIEVTEVPEHEEREERVEDIIQRSTNMVAHIDEITLREPTLPEQQPLLNDNFGELNPDVQLLADKSLEMMMAPNTSLAQHSLELPTLELSTDRSRDRSHLMVHEAAQMERMSAHDLTLYRKSVGDDLLPMGDIEKDVPVPELPDVTVTLPPEPPVPQPDVRIPEDEISKEKEHPKDVPIEEPRAIEPEIVVLEELEEGQPQAKRRRKIMDKNTKLSSNYLRARIATVAVELRCEDSVDDVIDIRVPADMLLSRPAHSGRRLRAGASYTLAALFTRNLAVVDKRPLAERELKETEAPRVKRSRVPSRSVLQTIAEAELPLDIEPQPMQEQQPTCEQEQPIDQQHQPLDQEQPIELQLSVPMETTLPRALQEMDISDLPTQVIPTLSQAQKRSSEYNPSPKRRCHSGYVAWSQQKGKEMTEADKENISDNIQQEAITGQHLTLLLQGAGLADVTPQRDSQRPQTENNLKEACRRARIDSDSSETPLGSLDRTKVSLGDSVTTTDSKRFIRDEWGTEGTMIKILHCVKAGVAPLDIASLLSRGPQISGYRRVIAARCFTSILKLKQHAFINITKNPETLEVTDIALGAKFDDVV